MSDQAPHYPCRVDDSPFRWIGADQQFQDAGERLLVHARDRAVVWGGVTSGEEGVGFDDLALVSVGPVFLIVRSTGCCCPYRADVWAVGASGDLDDLWRRFQTPLGCGFAFPTFAEEPVRTAFELARRLLDP